MLAWLVLVGVAIVVVVMIVLHNQLARARNQVAEAWSAVDVQLRQRASLVPNLVDVVSGYAQHERGTLEEVTRARAGLDSRGGPGNATAAEGVLGQALGRLLAVSENYPQLRAAENFRQLQSDLAEVEARIAYARNFYNRTVLAYNNLVTTFPTGFIANAFRFVPAEFFQADEAGRAEVRATMGGTRS